MLLSILPLSACTTTQWYDSPIPVKVELKKANTQVTNQQTKHQNP